MAYNPQMPQQAQQMPQQGQTQYQNPAANWQRTYQNSQWARQVPQYQQNPYQQMPQQYQGQQYQQNPYQRQMPQQMPQQYQQQFQMPRFSQQQINQFLSYMQNRPMPGFMSDPRYQAQQFQKPVYQPTPQPTARTYVPAVQWGESPGVMAGLGRPTYTVGDSGADAYVKANAGTNLNLRDPKEKARIESLYKQYYAGAQ